jgi:hypothetical protein
LVVSRRKTCDSAVTPCVIGFVFNPGRLDRLDACRRGEAPSEFFYGAIELAARGLDIRFFETDPATPVHWPCAAFNFIGQNGPVKLDGSFLQSTGNLLNRLNDCDVVVGITGHASGFCALPSSPYKPGFLTIR